MCLLAILWIIFSLGGILWFIAFGWFKSAEKSLERKSGIDQPGPKFVAKIGSGFAMIFGAFIMVGLLLLACQITRIVYVNTKEMESLRFNAQVDTVRTLRRQLNTERLDALGRHAQLTAARRTLLDQANRDLRDAEHTAERRAVFEGSAQIFRAQTILDETLRAHGVELTRVDSWNSLI